MNWRKLPNSTDAIRRLKRQLSTCTPFAIVALSLVQYEHAFWGTRILRWHVNVTDELYRFCVLVDSALAESGAELHYPFSTSREPKHATALEDVPEADLDAYLRFLQVIHAQVHEWISTDVTVSGADMAALIERADASARGSEGGGE